MAGKVTSVLAAALAVPVLVEDDDAGACAGRSLEEQAQHTHPTRVSMSRATRAMLQVYRNAGARGLPWLVTFMQYDLDPLRSFPSCCSRSCSRGTSHYGRLNATHSPAWVLEPIGMTMYCLPLYI